MLEGLAVWALFIYILRLIGMPWTKPFKIFAYLGGGMWLGFVWIGLINYTPMDLSGGSVVQAPHIQLRPGNTQIKGKVEKIHIKPNTKVKEGQLIYELDAEPYEIKVEQALVKLNSAQVGHGVALEELELAYNNYDTSLLELEITKSNLLSAKDDHKLQKNVLKRYQDQNSVVEFTITESLLDEQATKTSLAYNKIKSFENEVRLSEVMITEAKVQIEKAKLNILEAEAEIRNAKENHAQALWDLGETKIHAPTDGFVTNFILREGQYVGILSRMQMYTDEKYVLMRVNHQAIRNVKAGQLAEFATPVYPGKIFAAEVQGVIEATGESEAGSLGRELSVSKTTLQNVKNKFHFVRLKLIEPEGYDIPVGAVGLGWISGEKPTHLLSFLDVIRGIIIRMKSQIYYVYSL